MNTDVKALAFYLPQYHPISENDEWWGRGFTEWTNVTKACPSFPGHYQPHLPADLGFYDLRLPEAREAQADLAKQYGIHGFCYYHYWFGGRRLLERPFNEVLATGRPDFPFCLCWANEPWSRRWDGSEQEVLMSQTYSEEDDRQHIRWLLDAFRDPRYIRIAGKPLFLIYKASQLPNAKQTGEIWREEAKIRGVGDLFLCNVECGPTEHGVCSGIGFDGAVEFAPDWDHLGPPLGRSRLQHVLTRVGLHPRGYTDHYVCEYKQLMETMLRKPDTSYIRFPGVTPMWDNSARKKRGLVLVDSDPGLYEQWLRAVVKKIQNSGSEHRFVFINAWNEWAEGNHLEPCRRFGRSYLEATRTALT